MKPDNETELEALAQDRHDSDLPDDFPAKLNGLEWPYDNADLRPEIERAWNQT